MGCDGGTIPTRDELVKTKKKPEQKDKTADLAAKWRHCAITQESLVLPIMACELGRLYNKESVLELLLDRSKFECADSFRHLKGLKDLRELNLSRNRGYVGKGAEKGDCYIDTQTSTYACPVTGLEINGAYRFCFPWSCGCVVSERALKAVRSETCHKCEQKVLKDDIIILNPPESEVDEIRIKMEMRRLKARQLKKAQKAEKRKAASATVDTTDTTEEGPSTSIKQVRFADVPKCKLVNGTSLKKTSTVGLKTEQGKSIDGKTDDKTSKKKGIQEDTSVSSTYKSLFTTSEKAKNQQKAHWVTFNPMYY